MGGVMTKKLSDFLIELSDNPTEVTTFAADPDAFVDRSELSEQDKKLLKSGNVQAIEEKIQADETIFSVRGRSATSIVLPKPEPDDPQS
jgi:hypothetical protein